MTENDEVRDRSGEGRPPNGGPHPPYGPPILDAIASGDLQQMKAVAAAARRALYGVEFEPVSERNADEVRDALERLDEAIRRLEGNDPTAERG